MNDSSIKEESILAGSAKEDSFQIKDTNCLAENKRIAALEAQLNISQEQTSSSEQSLTEEISQLRNDKKSFNQKLASVSEELDATRNQIKEKEQAQLSLTEKVEELEEQITLLKDSPPKGKKSRARFRNTASSVNKGIAPKQVAEKTVDPTTLKRAKREFRSNLIRIEILIKERKNYFDEARKSKTVGISPRQLASKNGLSLDRLRSLIDKADENSKLSLIRQGLYDIEQLLKEDIKVAAKVAKL